jgi:hypothetical protein
LPDTVSTIDAAAQAGLTYRQVSHWIAVGALTPAHGSGGSGSRYRFTTTQVEHLRQIAIVWRLLDQLDVGDIQTDFVRRIWVALETTGTFTYTEGPLVIKLPWAPEDEEPEPVA